MIYKAQKYSISSSSSSSSNNDKQKNNNLLAPDGGTKVVHPSHLPASRSEMFFSPSLAVEFVRLFHLVTCMGYVELRNVMFS